MAKRGRAAWLGASAKESDDRLAGGHSTAYLFEALCVAKRFRVEQDDTTGAISTELLQIFGQAQLHAVADTDHGTERDAERMTGGDSFFRDCAGLGNQRDAAAARHIAQERRSEAARSLEQIDVARAVGAADGQPVRLGQRTQLAVACFAILPTLGKAAWQDQ